MKNKYVKRSKISESKFRQLLKHFALDLDVQQISLLCKLNRNTVNRYLYLIRVRIAKLCEHGSPFQGKAEIDKSYFEGHKIKGKRGQRATGKKVISGILERRGKVYTEIVPNCAKATLQTIIWDKATDDSIIHSDDCPGYDGVVDLGYKKHYSVHHGKNEFDSNKTNINDIESFWSFAKRRLTRFHAAPRSIFYLIIYPKK